MFVGDIDQVCRDCGRYNIAAWLGCAAIDSLW